MMMQGKAGDKFDKLVRKNTQATADGLPPQKAKKPE